MATSHHFDLFDPVFVLSDLDRVHVLDFNALFVLCLYPGVFQETALTSAAQPVSIYNCRPFLFRLHAHVPD
jgi:hypothetical protein